MMRVVIRKKKPEGAVGKSRVGRGTRCDSDKPEPPSVPPIEESSASTVTAVGSDGKEETTSIHQGSGSSSNDDNLSAPRTGMPTRGWTVSFGEKAAAASSVPTSDEPQGLQRDEKNTNFVDDLPSRSSVGGGAASVRRSVTSVGSDLTRDPSSSLSKLFAGATSSSASSPLSLSSFFSRRPMSLSSYLSTSSQSRWKLQELTVNKLQFSNLARLYGRESECRRLEEAWEDVRASFQRRHDGRGIGLDKSSAEQSLVVVADAAYSQGGGGGAAAVVEAPAPNIAPFRRRFVAISGEPGAGKTSLAGALRSNVVRSGGLFVLGKFPQPSVAASAPTTPPSSDTTEPFSAFAQATARLCKSVIDHYSSQSWQQRNDPAPLGGAMASRATRVGSLSSLARFRDQLGTEIGPDASLVIRVIPESVQLLSSQGGSSGSNGPNLPISFSEPAFECDVSAGLKETQHQFKHAFRRFIRAVTRIAPLVLVLDDMQWADAASLDLLEALLSDRETSSLMVVGCYRSTTCEDSFPDHDPIKQGNQNSPLETCIQAILALSTLDRSLTFDSIVVENLSVVQINDLLMDLLSLPASETLNLAYCVHKKTRGNIFFVIKYLQMLEETALLEYNICALKWTFDLSAIRDSTFATENVVHLVKRKLERLPAATVEVLPIMACLGSTFSLRSFELIVDRIPTMDVLKSRDGSEDPTRFPTDTPRSLAVRYLSQCEEEGLIEMRNDHGKAMYQWVHDKIQEAAFSLLSEGFLRNLKRTMGKILWQGFDSVELEDNIFLVSRLLSMSASDGERSKELSNLFLRAGVKAVERSAFDIASGFLRSGIDQLSENPWEVDSKLSLDLFSTAAEVEFCLGNLELTKHHCDEVIRRENLPFLDKRRAYNVLIACAFAKQRKDDAFALCKDLLSKLGCRFPQRAVPLHVAAGIFRVKSSLKRYTGHESINQLPILEDEKNRWMMTLLDKLATCAYLTNPLLLPLIVFKGLHITLKAGLCEYAPPMFASIGFLMTAFVGDFQAGQAFADKAIELLGRVKAARKVEARVLFLTHTFILHWTRPVSLSLKPLLTAFQSGVATGDTESASCGICFYIDHAFRTGKPLQELIEDCEFYSESIKESQQMNFLVVVEYLWQTFKFLTGNNKFAGSFRGDIVDSDKVLREVSRENYDVLFFGIKRLEMYVAFVLGQYRHVYDLIILTRTHQWSYEKVFPGIFGLCHLYTFNGLSMINLYRVTKEKRHLRIARKFASQIKKWTTKGVSV
jgi:predicted ATPase